MDISAFAHIDFEAVDLQWRNEKTESQKFSGLPAIMQETRIWSLAWEDPLEKRMATHSSILAWSVPYTEESGGLQAIGII